MEGLHFLMLCVCVSLVLVSGTPSRRGTSNKLASNWPVDDERERYSASRIMTSTVQKIGLLFEIRCFLVNDIKACAKRPRELRIGVGQV